MTDVGYTGGISTFSIKFIYLKWKEPTTAYSTARIGGLRLIIKL